jgi:kynurenine formamidase
MTFPLRAELQKENRLANTETLIIETAEKYRNWGKWGEEDQLGTLNYINAAKLAEAGQLVKQGKVFSLALAFDRRGPQTQTGGSLRYNPIHVMLFDGGDLDTPIFAAAPGFGAADDQVTMPLQCATHWDALSHVFDHGKMWNGYSAKEVSSLGARRNGIENTSSKLVSRGVLLDIPRFKGVASLDDGYAISEADLLGCIEAQGTTSQIGRGDIVLVRTGQLGRAQAVKWGSYAGGNAPGLSFYSLDWLHRTEIAAIASDTWSVEVRPHELPGAIHPFHQVAIPNIGLTLGEMFVLDNLAADCASDGIYEFLLAAAPLPFTGAVGAPVHPLALK